MPKAPRKKSKDLPKGVRPFAFHGTDVDPSNTSGDQIVCQCSFCGSEEKLWIHRDTTKWQCFICRAERRKEEGASGNSTGFLRLLHTLSLESTEPEHYEELAHDRKLHPNSLMRWGVAKSYIDGTWLVPGYNSKGQMCNLYRYGWNYKTKRSMLYPTPPSEIHGHQLFGVPQLDPSCDTIYLCESIWDSIAAWEIVGDCVLGIPTLQTFRDSWVELFKGKHVRLALDNDHPRTNKITGEEEPPAVLSVLQRISSMISGVARSVEYSSHDLESSELPNLQLPSGYDVRDWINADD